MERNEMRGGATGRGPELLELVSSCYADWEGYRNERLRNKRFTYGDQWSDSISIGGRTMTEDEHLRSQGHLPLKNNLIRRLVRNVLGVWRDRHVEPQCRTRDGAESPEGVTMQKLLAYTSDLNRMSEIYARSMEEFLISGFVIHKKWYGRKSGRTDCWTDYVQPDRFFMDAAGRDFRGWDTGLVGEIHEMRQEDLISTFARNSREADELRRHYGEADMGMSRRCRVYEVWVKEHHERLRCHDPKTGRLWKREREAEGEIAVENRARSRRGEPEIESRWFIDEEWHWYFISPTGAILATGITPYSHGGPPYIYKAYPFIDGEIHSFVADIIDQQKLTNRLISMYDWILSASAKGVLLMPEGAIPPGTSLDEIADEWSRFDGVIVYRPKAGNPLPQQVSSKSADIGITELLNIQMKMMEDISGVNGALQGKLETSSMSGTLYNQQTRNSLTALADLIQSFDDFVKEGLRMEAANIMQYYNEERIRRIAGENAELRLKENFDGSLYDFRI